MNSKQLVILSKLQAMMVLTGEAFGFGCAPTIPPTLVRSEAGERLASHTHGAPLLGMPVHCTGVGAASSVLGGRGVAAEAGCALSGTGRA